MKKGTENSLLQKPHTMDAPIYEKPHAYDEDPPIVTASRHNSRSSKMTVDSYASRYFQRRGPTAISCFASPPPSTANTSPVTTITSSSNYYSPNTPIESPPPSPKSRIKRLERRYNTQIDYCNITSFVLSQALPTTQTNFGHHHEDIITPENTLPSSPKNSIIDVGTTNKGTDIAAAAAALLSNDSGIVSSFFLKQNKRRGPIIPPNLTTTATHKKLNTNPNSNVITYSFRKSSRLTPDQHEIFLHIDHPDEDDEDVMVYRKIQPYSYIWGTFQSMLYSNRNDGQGIKVAEARRSAFQKDIVIEAADYENSLIEDITQPYINNIKNIPATNNIHAHDLIKRSQSNILFEYEIWFNGSRMRWRRPSLLSHDFTCEVKLTRQETKLFHQKNNKNFHVVKKDDGFIDSDSDDDEDDHDNHTHKTCRRWKVIAEFDSHTMSFLNKELGTLSIDLDMLNQVEKERCNLLEANMIMTCCTLIDLIRNIMGK